MIRHYILTRFNIRLWRADKHLQPTLDEEWLASRFELFEKYCLPSVAAQTEKNFSWIVLFDRQTPLQFRDRLNSCREQCPQLLPIFVRSDGGRLFRKVFREVIAHDLDEKNGKNAQSDSNPQHPTSNTQHLKVITTYLDNDDAISTDYVERVQQAAQSLGDRTYITFFYGLQYFTDLNIATRVSYKENHFNSFVEVPGPNNEVLTTYCCSHALILKQKQFAVHCIKTSDAPAWIEVVHPRNAMNDILLRRATVLVTDRNLLRKRFNVDIVLRKNAWKTFTTTFLWRMLKAYVHYAVKKWRGY
ncbi:MAG: hypothetical protein J5506_03015 [Prevotella sp.]|nr:hypothetical protein [Prevotella sp.]